MKGTIVLLLVFSFLLDLDEGATHWELQTLDVPPSHIPYFTRNKNHEQGFCKNGAWQVNRSSFL